MHSNLFTKIFSTYWIKNLIICKSKNNKINIPKSLYGQVKLKIKGNNNNIVIKNKNIKGRISISIYGDNNTIMIDDNVKISLKLSIDIGQKHNNFGKANNSTFTIGNNTSIEECKYITYNSNCYCNIGENCMISSNVFIYNTDAHPIFNMGTKIPINKIKGITIGNHCWIGMNVSILKNSYIPNNSIIGYSSVFATDKFTQENCAFAGNPAKVIKDNIDWDFNGAICGYIENKA